MSAALALDASASAEANRFVAFTVADRGFALPIEDVREIRAWSGVTALPNAPTYVLGVMNLRGAILPIIDVRARFGLGVTEPTPTHVVIVSAIAGRPLGLLVDTVSDILDAEPDALRPVPEEASADRRGLHGLLAHKDQLMAIVDVTQLADL